MTAGEYVEYVTTTDPTGKVLANNVTGILKGPLLCERPRPKKRGKGEDGDPSTDTAAPVAEVSS